MPSSPNQFPPGKQFELRVAASDLELDEKLSALTIPANRSSLSGFLNLYSEQSFFLDVQDRDIDGLSNTEARFKAFHMRITNRNRNKFSLGSKIEKIHYATGEEETRIRVVLELGIQVASELMTPPFFTPKQREAESIPLYYTIPEPVHTRMIGVAFEDLESFLAKKPRSIVDELMLVESAFRTRAIRHRTRAENPVLEPAVLEAPDGTVQGENYNLREVS